MRRIEIPTIAFVVSGLIAVKGLTILNVVPDVTISRWVVFASVSVFLFDHECCFHREDCLKNTEGFLHAKFQVMSRSIS